jgi:hypothetical protein
MAEATWYNGQWFPARTFPTIKVIKRPHLHFIVATVSCIYLPSNCLDSEDTLLDKTTPWGKDRRKGYKRVNMVELCTHE